MVRFKDSLCTCSHAKKHHKASGRCRPGCTCRYGARRQARKIARKVLR